MERISNKRGGYRPNSGRPANDRNFTLHVRISKEANDIVCAQHNKSVSIHTPARGVTGEYLPFGAKGFVSIHTPARGVTP